MKVAIVGWSSKGVSGSLESAVILEFVLIRRE
jgi:hypothetical protein